MRQLTPALLFDLRLACRRLVKRPAFTVLAGSLCAIAIAATLTLFATVKSVAFDPLPFPDSERLVAVWGTVERFDLTEYPFSWVNFNDYRAATTSTFEDLAAFRGTSFTLDGPEPLLVEGVRVSRHLLRLLGARPVLGTDFMDDAPADSALLGHELWATRFDADPGIVGRTVVIDGAPRTVLGVLPPDLRLPSVNADLLVPFEPIGFEENRAYHNLRVVGRLRAGVEQDTATAELQAIAARLEADFPDANRNLGARLLPLREQIVGSSRGSLQLLFAAVAVVFLIACGNLALLQVASGVARRPELALRAALGAGRSGLVRMQAVESALLALVSGLAGLGLASLAVSALRRVDPLTLPRAGEITLDAIAALVLLATVIVAAALAATAPALEGLRAGASLRSRSFGTGATERLQSIFVGGQVALSLVLVLLASSLAGRYASLVNVDPGFRVQVATATVALSGPQHATQEQRLRAVDAALETLAAAPGVEAAGAISRLPFTPGNASAGVRLEGAPADEPGPNANFRWVTEGTFDALGIPLLRGRGLLPTDDADAPRVLLVDQLLAQALWGDASPLGQRIKVGALDGLWEVVGVVPPLRLIGIAAEPEPAIYTSAAQNPFPPASLEPRFVVATLGDPAGFSKTLRSTLQGALPGQAIHKVQSLGDHLRRSLIDRRLVLAVSLAFAATALILATVGTYSLVAFRVAQRRREWALRAALGAAPSGVVRSAARSGLLPVACGLALGVALAAVLAWQLLARGLTDGGPQPGAIATTLVALLGAATLASIVPATRAARYDPAPALRGDAC